MNRYLSAMTLAGAALTATFAQAAPEDWEHDPTVVYHEVKHSSCTKPENGQPQTVTFSVEVLAIKKSWDNASLAQKDSYAGVAREVLDREWRPRVADFTKDEISDRINAYRRAANNGLTHVGDEIQRITGIETMAGIDLEPDFQPGCTLK